MAEIIIRFIAGGSLVVIVSLLAKAGHPQIAALAVLFPVVTIVGYWFALSSGIEDQASGSFPQGLSNCFTFFVRQIVF